MSTLDMQDRVTFLVAQKEDHEGVFELRSKTSCVKCLGNIFGDAGLNQDAGFIVANPRSETQS